MTQWHQQTHQLPRIDILAQCQSRHRAGMSQGENDHRAPSSWRCTTVLWPFLCVLLWFLTAAVVYQAYRPSAGGQWSTVQFHTAETAASNSAGTPQQQQQQLPQLQLIEQQLQQEVDTLQSISKQLQQGQALGVQNTGTLQYAAIQPQADSIKAISKEIAAQQTQLLETITQLRSALVQPQTQRARAAAVAAITGDQTSGVICTVLRNEAKYVSEWIAFHLLMGATKIVIYDDNSTDPLQAAVAPYRDAVDVIRLQDAPGVPGDTQVHRVASRQDWAFQHCKRNYASNTSAGWFGIWDVDEFVFPCMPPTTQGNMLWDAWTSSIKPGADAHELRCNRFGQNPEDLPQADGELVLLNNIRRAPDPLLEPTAAPLTEAATGPGCSQCGCCQSTSHKTIYDITKVSRLTLWTHGTHTQDAVLDKTVQRPYAGLCCNHYQFKSTKEASDKAQANLNSFYEKVATTPDAKKYYTMLQDTLIWPYLPSLLDLLQEKGVEVNMSRVEAMRP